MSIASGRASHLLGQKWPANADIKSLIGGPWRPVPFRTFILKIHSRCNLKCSYCYVYEMADQSWRAQPRIMSADTVDMVAARIAEHVITHQLDVIELVLHGGEPLLAGPELIAVSVSKIRNAVAGHANVRVSVQTNGTRLGDELLAQLKRFDVGIGISLDGDRDAHDRHRRLPSGQGSHAAVMTALTLLTKPTNRHLFNGLLCTIDLRNDPVASYEALLTFSPPLVDFLLPNGNWSAPPPGRSPGHPAVPYAEWLIAVFDRWYHAPAKETGIRLFEEIINLLLGGSSRTEDVGLSPLAAIVVETNGDIEQSDLLKSTYQGAAAIGLNVAADSFDAALYTTQTAARQLGFDALAPECQACPVARVCGGGSYSHRYGHGRGFANPSVYCPDLYRLIQHIRDQLARDLALLNPGSA
jgi:uncharacterized protein